MKSINTDELNLGEYLSLKKGTLSIPFSQRHYEWGDDQVKRLFNDLTGLNDLDDMGTHMLNFFTFSNEENVKKIFDGQQRTVTILLLSTVFIKKIHELGNNKAASQFYRDMLVEEDYRTTPVLEKRKLVFDEEEVNELFYEIVNYLEDNKFDHLNYSNKSSKAIVKNFNYLTSLLDKYIEERDIDINTLLSLFNKILNNCQLITIETDTDELAMAMFETLNNTGKKLENFYVLKNDLVMALSEDKVKQKWLKIESNIEGYSASKFMLAFATIESGKISKDSGLKKIYQIHEKSNEKSMNSLLETLVKASGYYLEIVNPSQLISRVDKQQTIKYKELSQALSLFGFTQHQPLILAMMMKEMSIVDVNNILSSLLNLAIRNFYFKEAKANTIEVPLANLAKEVYKDSLNTSLISKKIHELTIQDGDIEIAVKLKKINTNAEERKLKYILKETYNYNDLKEELKIKDSLENIQYEHILPKNPSEGSQWLIDFSNPSDRYNYTRSIGNATLLLEKINKNASNRDFKEKVLRYKESKIPENELIAKELSWTRESIDNRNKLLAKNIIKYLNSLV